MDYEEKVVVGMLRVQGRSYFLLNRQKRTSDRKGEFLYQFTVVPPTIKRRIYEHDVYEHPRTILTTDFAIEISPEFVKTILVEIYQEN